MVGHARLRYEVRREEMRLAGFADLSEGLVDVLDLGMMVVVVEVVVMIDARMRGCETYFSTAAMLWVRTAANSLTRCGLLPVFSSCRIVPTTTSSLMPSVSILCTEAAPGEGGGVCSASRDGGSGLTRMFVDAGGLIDVGGGVVEPCDHFAFFDSGSSSMTVAGGEGCVTEGALARLGRWIPRSASETDFLRVLTGMVRCGCWFICLLVGR